MIAPLGAGKENKEDTPCEKLVGVWVGGGLIPIRYTFHKDGTFEQRYELPEGNPDRLPESGKWTFDGTTLTREILKSEEKDRVDKKLTGKVKQLKDGLLILTTDHGQLGYHRAHLFRDLALLSLYGHTKPEELLDLFEERPKGSGSYEIRADVKTIYSELDGTVYHRPDKNLYFIQSDPLGSGTLTYYGPYPGDPQKRINLPDPAGTK